MVHNNKRKKPLLRGYHLNRILDTMPIAPDNPSNKDQETPPDKNNPKDGIYPNPNSSQWTTENIVSEPNQLNEDRMVMGLLPTPWVEEQYSQCECQGHTQYLWTESYLQDRSVEQGAIQIRSSI